MSEVKDVQAEWIDSDIEKVQKKQNLYIQEYGNELISHTWREIVQNSLDELNDDNSNGKSITLEYDKLSDNLIIEDDGRGFPEDNITLEIFCTKLQSGSKFYRDQGGATNGELNNAKLTLNLLNCWEL